MVKELDVSCIEDFSVRIKRAMTRATHGGLTVGFEWEIPMVDGEYARIPVDGPSNTPFTRDWANDHGFSCHNDSGGREMCSPIFQNVITARRFAQWLEEAASENRNFMVDRSNTNCGIHVHAADHLMTHDMNDYLTRADRIHTTAQFILNREENRSWLWAFSGRHEGQDYSSQAKVTGWDNRRLNMRNIIPMSMVKLNVNPSRDPDPSTNSTTTCEFRIWSAHKDRLIPAIDFGHSFFRFCREFVDSTTAQDFRRNTVGSVRQMFNDFSQAAYEPVIQAKVDRMNSFYPRIGDYLQWLNRTKGYIALKTDFENYAFPA